MPKNKENQEREKETGDQRIRKVTKKRYLTRIDALLKRIMDPTLKLETIKISKKLSHEKRLKKRKANQDKNAPKKPRYQAPKHFNPTLEKEEIETNSQGKRTKQREIEKNNKAEKQSKTEEKSNINQLRRSRRVPKLSAKYLESIQTGEQELE